MNRRFWYNAIVSLCLGCASRVGAEVISIPANEANVTILNDRFRNSVLQNTGKELTVGDFNGDGRDDVAIVMQSSTPARSIELFLAPFENESTYSTKTSMTIFFDGTGLEFGLPSRSMVDVNADGMADLLISRYDSVAHTAAVEFFLGRKDPKPFIDIAQEIPSLHVTGAGGETSFPLAAAGDFDGDGAGDYAVLFSVGKSTCYLIRGGGDLPSGMVSLSSTDPFPRISLTGQSTLGLVVGDFNGDGRGDIALGNNLGAMTVVDVFFGRDVLPVTGGAGLPPDVQIVGKYFDAYGLQTIINPVAIGDLTGDQHDELFIQGSSLGYPTWVVNGIDISSTTAILRQEPNLPESIDFFSVPSETQNILGWDIIAPDFDGDNTDDLFAFYSTDMGGILTSESPSSNILLSNMGSPTLHWAGHFVLNGRGDFNGDGYQDVVVYEEYGSVVPPYGALRMLYGFRPFKNPSIEAVSGAGDRLRVILSLSVDGSPTEMRLTGDFSDNFNGVWIPFVSIVEVVLTSVNGNKTLGVQFRNSVGRVSDRVETVVTVAVESPHVVLQNNRLRPGGVVDVHCHVLARGSLRARIFGPNGDVVREIDDRCVDPGIYPVQWDGRNAFGNRVARGVYYFYIEANGERTQKEILVE